MHRLVGCLPSCLFNSTEINRRSNFTKLAPKKTRENGVCKKQFFPVIFNKAKQRPETFNSPEVGLKQLPSIMPGKFTPSCCLSFYKSVELYMLHHCSRTKVDLVTVSRLQRSLHLLKDFWCLYKLLCFKSVIFSIARTTIPSYVVSMFAICRVVWSGYHVVDTVGYFNKMHRKL